MTKNEKRRQRYERLNSSYFRYVNVNPKSIITTDCVVRALAGASGITWDDVFDKLVTICKKFKLMPDNEKSYKRLLNELGFEQMKQPKHSDNTKFTGKEFCDVLPVMFDTPIEIFCNIGSHHCTCIRPEGGYHIEDIWDCSEEKIGKYWIRKLEG